MLSIMGERERTQEYGNEIHCHVFTFAKFQENTTILSYNYTCTIYRIYNIRKRHCSVGITGYEYLLASFPGLFVGGGKTAWYRLFAHERNIPFIQRIFSSIIL